MGPVGNGNAGKVSLSAGQMLVKRISAPLTGRAQAALSGCGVLNRLLCILRREILL